MKLTSPKNNGASWKFGSCHSSLLYGYNKQYTERCCLAPALEYTLICKMVNGFGWGDGFMEIEGHRYCDDFIGYRAMRRVTILGIDIYIKIYYRGSFNIHKTSIEKYEILLY